MAGKIRLRQVSSPPLEVRDYIHQSEVATMMFLQSRTRVPVPKVVDWSTESDRENDVGLGYILMGKVQGKPLNWQKLTEQQKEKIMQQLADIFLEIERHPYDRIGSLMPSGSEGMGFEIQGIAHHSTFDMAELKGRPLGPFDTSAEAARALVEHYLGMIEGGEIDCGYLDDVRLAHQLRLDVVDRLWQGQQRERFYLKHPDDKGDHILVDDSFTIVGIIDREWAQTVSKEEAFSLPCMMWPVARFYEGSNELSDDEIRFAAIFRERGRDDLAECVMNGRKVQRFCFALGPGCVAHGDRETFMDLFAGLRRAVVADEDRLAGLRDEGFGDAAEARRQ
jgi:hypothetical protein